jgi:hypothetical protein
VTTREGRRHTVLQRANVTLVVPRHRGDLPTGTFHAILKQAGLSAERYLNLR